MRIRQLERENRQQGKNKEIGHFEPSFDGEGEWKYSDDLNRL